MNPGDLLNIAEYLASGGIGSRIGRPRQAELKRAVSASYYALFHTLATNSADLLVGNRTSTRTRQAWRQMYRAIDHGRVKRQCSKRTIAKFPQEIQKFAHHFVMMQAQRHMADYDPMEQFSRSSVAQLLEETKSAITEFETVDNDDRRAFAVFVLFDLRGN